jgi:hypothetical protein
VRWLAAAPVLFAGCYPGVDNSDCAIRCGDDNACPSNLSCVDTFCIEEGQTCGPSGLVLAYSFDVIEGGVVPDDSFTGNDGTTRGAPDLVDAVHGKGLSLDGTSDSVAVPHSSSLAVAPGGAFTVELWVLVERRPVFDNDQLIVGKVWNDEGIQSPFYEFGIEFDKDIEELELFMGDENDAIHAGFRIQPIFGDFAHVAYTYDGDRVVGYLNGEPQASAAGQLQITIPNRAQNLMIGGQGSNVEFFLGKVDDLRIYNRALSADEIGADMTRPVRP